MTPHFELGFLICLRENIQVCPSSLLGVSRYAVSVTIHLTFPIYEAAVTKTNSTLSVRKTLFKNLQGFKKYVTLTTTTVCVLRAEGASMARMSIAIHRSSTPSFQVQ